MEIEQLKTTSEDENNKTQNVTVPSKNDVVTKEKEENKKENGKKKSVTPKTSNKSVPVRRSRRIQKAAEEIKLGWLKS